MNRLRHSERCPLHKSYACVCKGEGPKRPPTKPKFVHGVRRVDDPFHPRGYREICSPAELKRRKHILMLSDPVCIYCGKNFLEDGSHYNEVHLAHRESKGMNGAKHDDHMSNLGLAHAAENLANGSRKVA
jgi:hypothetical protein